jgi:hypothetical protein
MTLRRLRPAALTAPSPRMRWARRTTATWVASLLVVLLLAEVASAAPSLSLATGTDPTESVTTQAIATGSAESSSNRLVVTFKSAGGRACAANPDADGGTWVIDSDDHAGPFSKSVNQMFNQAGSYLLCGWLQDEATSGAPVVASTALVFGVRPPHLSLSIAAPSVVAPNQTFQIITTAQAEVDRQVDVLAVPDTGRGCPANSPAATGSTTVVDSWNVTGGPTTRTTNQSFDAAGGYLLCGYVYQNSTTPEATAVSPFSVVAPVPAPSSCVVPPLDAGTSLTTTTRRLTAAHCSAGPVTLAASSRYKRGTVVRLAAKTGGSLPAGSAVGLIISDGPACVVPRIRAGSSLTTAEKQLTKSHCSFGGTRHAANRRYRHGTVLWLSSKPGEKLAPRTKVRVTLSSGRRRTHRHLR